jgi:hypothetical protein
MVIRAVILDFGGTLSMGDLDWDPYHENLLAILAVRGFDMDMGELKDALRAALRGLAKVRDGGGERTFEAVYADFLGNLGVYPDHELLDRYTAFRPTTGPTTCHASRASRELSQRYMVALLSSTMSDHPRVCSREKRLRQVLRLHPVQQGRGVRKQPRDIQDRPQELGGA